MQEGNFITTFIIPQLYCYRLWVPLIVNNNVYLNIIINEGAKNTADVLYFII